MMSRHRAYLALGSNIHPEANLTAAVRLLERWGTVTPSTVWQSDPVGFTDQPDFLNAAVLLETVLSAEQLVSEVIPQIEQQLGRKRDPINKNAPRTIDVDLVMYDELLGHVAGREVPDPDILTRWFLAWPLAELAPHVRHPITGQSLEEIAERFKRADWQPLQRLDVDLTAALARG